MFGDACLADSNTNLKKQERDCHGSLRVRQCVVGEVAPRERCEGGARRSSQAPRAVAGEAGDGDADRSRRARLGCTARAALHTVGFDSLPGPAHLS